jgi:hypothetical protein
MIDEPVRAMCESKLVTYSTWIDDLAFSGDRSRELIQPTAAVLAANGLHVSRKKIKIMGPSAIKILTGTRLGLNRVRAPKEKLSRIRAGIHKLREGIVAPRDQEKYVNSIVAQLRFIEQLCPNDVSVYAQELSKATEGRVVAKSAEKYIASHA